MQIRLKYVQGLNVQLPCKYVRNAHFENPRKSAYKRGGTGVVLIQNFSRSGQREDGQCLSCLRFSECLAYVLVSGKVYKHILFL